MKGEVESTLNEQPSAGGASAAIVHRFTAPDLCALVPGTKRSSWLKQYIPMLVERGVLVRLGQAWFGRPDEIIAGLLGRDLFTGSQGSGQHSTK